MPTIAELYGGELFPYVESNVQSFAICSRTDDIKAYCDDCDDLVFDRINSYLSSQKINVSWLNLYCFNLFMALDYTIDIFQSEHLLSKKKEISDKVLSLLSREIERVSKIEKSVKHIDLNGLILSAVTFYRQCRRQDTVIDYEPIHLFGSGYWYYIFYDRLIPLHPDLLPELLTRNPQPTYRDSLRLRVQHLFWNILNYPREFDWVNDRLNYYEPSEGDECVQHFEDRGGEDFGTIINLYLISQQLNKETHRTTEQKGVSMPNIIPVNEVNAYEFLCETLNKITIKKDYDKRVFGDAICATITKGYMGYENGLLTPRVGRWKTDENGYPIIPKNRTFPQKQTFCYFIAAILGLSAEDRFPEDAMKKLFGEPLCWRRSWEKVKISKWKFMKKDEQAALRELLPENLLRLKEGSRIK